jgi:hypothetical protein
MLAVPGPIVELDPPQLTNPTIDAAAAAISASAAPYLITFFPA